MAAAPLAGGFVGVLTGVYEGSRGLDLHGVRRYADGDLSEHAAHAPNGAGGAPDLGVPVRDTAAGLLVKYGQATDWPAEAVRVMADYGNPDCIVLSNTQPIYPVGVTKGDLDYPPVVEMK